jgi:hypothetical protein
MPKMLMLGKKLRRNLTIKRKTPITSTRKIIMARKKTNLKIFSVASLLISLNLKNKLKL